MTEYYTNKPDFTTEPVVPPNTNGSSYSKTMSTIMGDIEAVGNTVKNEGVEDLYIQQGEAALGLTKDSSVFDKSLKRIYTMLVSARKVHSDIIQNIDSKFTKGMDNAFASLNNVNGAGKPYKSEYTKKAVTKEVSRGYSTSNGPLHESVTEYESYSLAELLDGKASPIQAAKDVYDERLRAATEMLAKKDQLSDEQIKALEGKSAEDIVAARYPSQLPDYQKLKASRYYEENKEKLQYVDTGLKVLAGLAMVGGVVLAPFTGGTSLYATYAGGAYLATDSAYSAATGHTMITGTQLSTEERVWAGIDAAVTVASMGSAAYLTQLAKAGVSGSTLLKGLASAGKYADDVNDVSKVIYAVASGGNPNSAIQNMVLGQVMGHGLGKAGKYTDVKFGRGGAPEVDVDLPGVRRPATDVDVLTKSKDLSTIKGEAVDHVETDKTKVELEDPLVNGPYIRDGKPYGRPTLTGDKKLEFERAVYNEQVGPDGVLREPYEPYDVIDWKPGQARRGVVDFGHQEGKSYSEMFRKYKNREITLQELKDFQFDPNNFRIEKPSANRDHSHE